MRIFLAALVVCTICFAPSLCQDSTTTTDLMPTTSTTTESAKSSTKPKTTTTTTATTTTTTTSTTSTTTTTTSTATTSTTTGSTTTATSTEAPTSPPTTSSPSTTTTTTTQATPSLAVFSFRVPEDESLPACLRVNTSLELTIDYVALINGTNTNESATLTLDKIDSYTGDCANNQSYNTLSVTFRTNWQLTFNYTLVNAAYFELFSVKLDYALDDNSTFPNAAEPSVKRTAFVANLTEFSANKGNSYKCFSKTILPVGDDVSLQLSNYQAQPFLSEKTQGFDTAIECSADTTGTSKLVPIIVGSALAVLVVLVLVAYVIGRRKHRPGYQQV